jgi:myosin heavy subunit
MELDKNLLKEFVKITNDSEVKSENKYLRGTIVKNSGGKYVQLDGSTTVTPISELVNVEEGDRVLVTIENHKATIVGNFSFPPSARKEQEAIDKANAAKNAADNVVNTANTAQQKAQEASDKADTAVNQISIATAAANEAKQQAAEAIELANNANDNISETKELAQQASAEAKEAKDSAATSQAASAEAQAEVSRLQGEVTAAKENINEALENLEDYTEQFKAIEETYSTKVELGETKAELETNISKKVGELETTISETYSTKTENVELEGRLQTQITQNTEGLTSQVSKIEKLESDTAEAQQKVNEAIAAAGAAETSAFAALALANMAEENAVAAQKAADEASEKAELATNAAEIAREHVTAADATLQSARTTLAEAEEELANVTSNPAATEEEIAEAQAKVDTAQAAVNKALAEVTEAEYAANKAEEVAAKAVIDAENAAGIASKARIDADNAKTAADKAEAAAAKAQADVAALTKKVETAETTIKQNSENITLNASKIEETGNKLLNDYYSKTETDAKIKVESDRISSVVSSVENMEIGGRNYILDSDVFTGTGTPSAGITSLIEDDIWKIVVDEGNENCHAWVHENTIEDNFQTGDEFTFSIEMKCDEGSTGKPKIYFKEGLGYYPLEGTVTTEYSVLHYTGIWNDEKELAFYFGWNEAVGTFYVRKMKFERGNRLTDWTPAPEDVDASIDTVQNNMDNRLNEVNTTIQTAQSSVDQLSNMISHLVTDANGESLMTQTSDGWTFNMSAITDNLNTIKDTIANMDTNSSDVNSTIEKLTNLVDSVVNKTAYITISTDDNGDPCIELGKSDNLFKVRITNTAIDFLEGSTRIAYANNNTFYSEKIITNEIQIGEGPGFVWRTRANGNMGLVYIS